MTDSDHERNERKNFLRELSAKRKKFQDGLDANEGDINLDIFEDFYPDNAHFVYELLQNAEDAKARNCRFVLFDDRCEFEHDGPELFTKADVKAITGIHTSTKTEAPDKIGNFGVGFKAVFVYTATPRIVSPTFSFEISHYVQLSPLAPDPQVGSLTRFVFPFNNSNKPCADAYADVERGLNDLSAAALLFLTNINTISWTVGNAPETHLLRIEHSAHHVEVVARNSVEQRGQHYLRFTESVDGVDRPRHCAVAFELEPLADTKQYDTGKPFAKQFRIVPASPGRVAVFFPAVKETSGLRFHLHAPFVPELSRASVKNTAANEPLFEQLANLAARSLHGVHNLDLLTADFLAVLPNPKDEIPDRYQRIREAIVHAMNEEPLTPTHRGRHAPAKTLVKGRDSLKSLLSTKDLAFLVRPERIDWAVSVSPKNSDADRFLASLDIADFDGKQFVNVLETCLKTEDFACDGVRGLVSGLGKDYLEWLGGHPDHWHQRLYAWVYDEWNGGIYRLKESLLVRLSTGEYKLGNECFFPCKGRTNDARLSRVAEGVYRSGKNKEQQEKAKAFLERIGVREVDEVAEVEAILKERYTGNSGPADDTHIGDLRRFIVLVEQKPARATLFRDFFIFQGSDGKWHKPNQVYLDSPYRKTGLAAFYNVTRLYPGCVSLTDIYRSFQKDKDRFSAFCDKVGVRTELSIDKCPAPNELRCGWYGKRERKSKISENWTIPHLETILQTRPSVELAILVWSTMCNASEDVLKARYSPNTKHAPNVGPSTLVQILTKHAWIPQGDGEFVRPLQADRARLPDGFPFDSGQRWIREIGFGKELAERQLEYRQKQAVAKDLGFDSKEALDDAKWFASLRPDERQRYKREHEWRSSPELPDSEPADPERRAQRVAEQAADAPDRQKEKRLRSVAKEYEAVKQEARQYLRPQYTNPDQETICQVCRAPLPFKLPDGQYYFEAVEFLPELKTKKHHYQNHLALCPNHAAMFVHANDSEDTLMSSFLQIAGQELPVVLAGKETSIYFTTTHIDDLKAVIKADQAAAEEA